MFSYKLQSNGSFIKSLNFIVYSGVLPSSRDGCIGRSLDDQISEATGQR